jgi:GTP cyclohydrolase I
MITVIIDKKGLDSWINYIDIDEAIEEAINTGSRCVKVNIEIYKGYSNKYDEIITEDYDTEEIDIIDDLGVTVEDVIDYCHFNCKEE